MATPEEQAAVQATADAAAAKAATDAAAAQAATDAAAAAKSVADAEAAKKAAAEAVPEKYEFQVPDGFYDPKIVDRVSAKAKAMGLSQAKAQELFNTTVEEVTTFNAAAKTGMDETVKGWENAVKADKELGGANYEKTIEGTKSVLTRFGSPELIELLDKSKLGSHPEMVRLFAKINKSMAEDDFHSGDRSGQGGKKDTASKLYDHPSSKIKE